MISKQQLQQNFETAKAEYKAGLQLILDSLNQGQQKSCSITRKFINYSNASAL